MPPINASHAHEDDDKARRNGFPHHLGRSRAPGQPLRRGDACLMCRAKKLKCSAQKPVCDQCAKRKDRCVYDAVRPASRVEQLERKLAEMDEQDFQEALARRVSASFSQFGFDQVNSHLPPSGSTNTLGQDNGIPNFGYNLLGVHPSTQMPSLNGDTTSPNSVDQILNTDTEPLVDINDMPLTAWSWPNTATTATFEPSQLNQPLVSAGVLPQFGQHPNPWTALGTPTATPTSFSFLNSHTSPPVNGFNTISAPSTACTSASSSRAQSHDSTTSPTPPQGLFNGSPPIPGLDNLNISLPSVQNALDPLQLYPSPTHQTKRAMKAKELSASARDYLLDLFFCPTPPRPQCGSELFSQEEFKARLSLPESDRPHPCLLFSMYTIAASGSYVPSIRKLAEPLFKIATMKLDVAIRKQDRLLDAIKACKNLSKWLFTKARILEGYQLSAKAITLCIACNLHQIPSSIFRTEDYDTSNNQASGLIRPPRDQADLADRIHTFWSAWGNERGGNLTHSWPSSIKDHNVTTPLPRNKADYSSNALIDEPDLSLRDLYDLPHRSDARAPRSLYAYILIAEHLIHRSMTLTQQPAESVSSSFRSQSVFAKGPHQMMIPSIHYPIAFKEILATAQWLEDQMPEEWGTSFMDSPKWQEPDVFVVALCLKVARMHLHPLESSKDYQVGLNTAFEASKLIKTLTAYYLQIQNTPPASAVSPTHALLPTTGDKGLDTRVHTPMPPFPFSPPIEVPVMENGNIGQKWDSKECSRNANGISGPYTLSPSFWVIEKLVGGAKLFDNMGRPDDARKCMMEAQTIITGYRTLGVKCNVVGEHVEKLEKLVAS
uniref:Zn(2)-C6 fungal-type domain-containing protein n=1 Tax=Kwoniella dejecticola CBS 10117 TaxID=1296121 RepID=A0A1A6A508_9TREE|nr:uncharacterized protein I303_04486 [Kwoniella dejecticola CBS 10117]OBR85154.1 hypothetical protein I303_04486 [Kwoniella dejecticola CBS 10117]